MTRTSALVHAFVVTAAMVSLCGVVSSDTHGYTSPPNFSYSERRPSGGVRFPYQQPYRGGSELNNFLRENDVSYVVKTAESVIPPPRPRRRPIVFNQSPNYAHSQNKGQQHQQQQHFNRPQTHNRYPIAQNFQQRPNRPVFKPYQPNHRPIVQMYAPYVGPPMMIHNGKKMPAPAGFMFSFEVLDMEGQKKGRSYLPSYNIPRANAGILPIQREPPYVGTNHLFPPYKRSDSSKAKKDSE